MPRYISVIIWPMYFEPLYSGLGPQFSAVCGSSVTVCEMCLGVIYYTFQALNFSDRLPNISLVFDLPIAYASWFKCVKEVKSVPKSILDEWQSNEVRERFAAYKNIREVEGGGDIVQWPRLKRLLDWPEIHEDLTDVNRLIIRRLGGPHGKAYYKALLIRRGVK